MEDLTEAIHAFWFGEIGADGFPVEDRGALWFQATPKTDALITERFGSALERARSQQSDINDPRQILAQVILYDQFSRNIFRNTPQAFAKDPLALSLSHKALRDNVPQALCLIERVFLFMPLEHSEVLADQEQSVALFTALLEETPPSRKKLAQGFLDYAHKHHEIIKRFGRFPHRNRSLGRASTLEERAFLEDGGSHFGQG